MSDRRAKDSAADRAEARATRRRWITLAEFVAVAGLVIGALGLWMNWSDRREDIADRAAERASERREHGVVTLTGTVAPDGDAIALGDSAHTLTDVSVRFPAALGVAVQDAMPGERIEARWFADRLLSLTDSGPDNQSGRLPVLVTSTWIDGADQHRDTDVYEVLWRTDGRLLRGRRLRLTGLVLKSRSGTLPRWTAPG